MIHSHNDIKTAAIRRIPPAPPTTAPTVAPTNDEVPPGTVAVVASSLEGSLVVGRFSVVNAGSVVSEESTQQFTCND